MYEEGRRDRHDPERGVGRLRRVWRKPARRHQEHTDAGVRDGRGRPVNPDAVAAPPVTLPSTEVFTVDPAAPDPGVIDRAAACIRQGGLVAFPTETVYGLGAHALDADAVARIFIAKERPANDPLIVHVASTDQVTALVAHMPDKARALASRFWPGPLTLVMRRSAAVPDVVTAGLDTVGVRIPSHPVARALLEASRLPIAAPSANLFSRPSPTRASH